MSLLDPINPLRGILESLGPQPADRIGAELDDEREHREPPRRRQPAPPRRAAQTPPAEPGHVDLRA